MHWNYRLVNMPSTNGGEDLFDLQEVFYTKNGQPTSYGDPCLFVEDIKDAEDLGVWIREAYTLPPLHEDDFKPKKKKGKKKKKCK